MMAKDIVFPLAMAALSASAAEWMTYPGDFEICLAERVQCERLEWGGYKPPFWPVPRHSSTVRFRKTFELAAPERIEAFADGEGHWRGVDERFGGFIGGRAVIDLPAGKTELYFEVWNRYRVPALYVKGRTVESDGSWQCDACDQRWVAAAVNGFADVGSPPGAFRLRTERREPAGVRKTDRGGLLADFGKETFGFVILRGVRGSGRAKIVYGESEKEALADGLADPFPGEKPNAADVWEIVTLKESSEVRLSGSRGFRYVNVVPLDKGLSVDSLSMLYEYLPLEERGSFRCDDEHVNRIWRTAAYTLRLTMREFFLDGIKRDRWIWSGDAYQSCLMNSYSFADAAIVRRTLTALGGKGPAIAHVNTIVDYTFFWMMAVRDYYLHTGDAAFVKFIWPRVRTYADWILSRCRPDGMCAWHEGDWVFVDWAPEPLDNNHGPVAVEQILLAQALTAAASCAEVVGDADKKSDYAARAKTLKESVVPTFWDEKRGGLVHALDNAGRQGSQLTRYANIFGLMDGYFEGERRRRVINEVLLNPSVMAIQTPYMRFYELESLCAVGRHDHVLAEIRSYWGGMLKEGATTFWELYNPREKGDEHLAMYGRTFGRSKCHAWGAAPLYLLGRYFLGVVPTAPGYLAYEVRPVLGGLKWMEGRVPTPSGNIAVSVRDGVVTVRGNAGKGVLRLSNGSHVIPPCADIRVPFEN